MYVDDIICVFCVFGELMFFLFKQKTENEMSMRDWRSDVCSSDLRADSDNVAACIRDPLHRRQFVGNPRRAEVIEEQVAFDRIEAGTTRFFGAHRARPGQAVEPEDLALAQRGHPLGHAILVDRKSTRLNSRT